MKNNKTLWIVITVALLCGIGLSCFIIGNEWQKNKNVETVKQLLTAIGRNISDYDQKGYKISFNQEYEVEYRNLTGLEDVDCSISYEGEGTVRLSYAFDGSEDIKPEISSLLLSDNACVAGSQNERIKYYCNELRDAGGEKISETENTDYGVNHGFTVIIDGEDFRAESESEYSDYKDPSNGKSDSFCGRINKKALSDAVTEEEISNAFSGMLFMEAWDYIDELRNLSNNYLKNLDFTNDEEVKKFISENEITTEEGEDNVVIIRFALDADRILSEITGKETDRIPDIYGTVKIEKDSGDVLYFSYDLSQCLLEMLMASGENKSYYKADVKDFTVEGEILNKPLDGITIDKECEEYSAEKVYDFTKKFLTHSVPFYDGIG